MQKKRQQVRDIKLILIGHIGTGKTALMNKWIKNEFNESYKATISTEFAMKLYQHNNKSYKVQVWDIGGQDRGPNFTKIFCKGTHGAIVVADITKSETLDIGLSWKTGIDDNVVFMDNSPLPMIIIQNKLDIKKEKNLEDKETELEYLEEFAKKNKFEAFYQTSAKTGENVDSAISQFLNLIIEKYEKYYTDASVEDDARTDNVKLEKQSTSQHKKCC